MGMLHKFSLFEFNKKTEYRWPFFAAIFFHIILFGLLIASAWWYRPTSYTMQNQAVQATLINSATLAAMQRAVSAPAPVAAKTPPPPQKVEPVKTQPQPLPKPEPKAAAQPTVKPLPAAKTKPDIKQKKIDQQKLLEQSLLQEEVSQQKVDKKAAQQAQEKLLEQQLAAEMAGDTKAQQQAQSTMSAKTQGVVDEYKAKILQQIQQNWIVPQNVTNLTCLLQVQVAPGGMVMNVTVLKSSGNAALDRSAVAAVNKASPLPVPKDSLAFAAFRTFTVTVKPEGASDIS